MQREVFAKLLLQHGFVIGPVAFYVILRERSLRPKKLYDDVRDPSLSLRVT